ncbi:MAG: DUF6128 domain-containing protein [Lachnospiraceae bacterium]|nr:DUF6128 domain-containing protein [Lachnospiraceae bacterium]
MSDYRRWISYIYAYENGIKKRNAGYAKLELKDGKLTMTLHVTPDGREGSLRVCMYKCHSGSREGVLLGVVEKKAGGEGVRFMEDASNVGGSGLLFQEMNGLLLYDERGKYLISSWEDDPVDLGVLQEIAAKLERTWANGKTQGRTEEGAVSGMEKTAGRMPEENLVSEVAENAGEESPVDAVETPGKAGEESLVSAAENAGEESPVDAVETPEKAEEESLVSAAENAGEESPVDAVETLGKAGEESFAGVADTSGRMKEDGLSGVAEETAGGMEEESPVSAMWKTIGERQGERLVSPVAGAAGMGEERITGGLGKVAEETGEEESAGAAGSLSEAAFGETKSKEPGRGTGRVTEAGMVDGTGGEGNQGSGGKPESKGIEAEPVPLHTGRAKIQAQSMQWEEEVEAIKANLIEITPKKAMGAGQTGREADTLQQASQRPKKAGVLPPGKLESRIFSCLPAMYPFEHQEFERSVRMEPQDIGLLPRGMWKYAGNSFLLHSYYAYHHILFVRKVRMEQRNCYLMLPGVYNPKEQHMAQLFGFSRFCPVSKKALQQGDFGYWYMEVEFPQDAVEFSQEDTELEF